VKRWLSLCGLILLATFCSYGQPRKGDGLSLTGTIVGLSAIAECGGPDGRILVRVELSMQFRNDGDRPLIVFRPHNAWPDIFDGELGTTQVNFLRSFPSASDKEFEVIQAKDIRKYDCRTPGPTYYSNYDPITSFIKRIDLPAPSSDFYVVIEPRSYHEFREVVTLDTGYDADMKVGKSLKEARVRSEYSAFQVQYHLSVKENVKGENLLRTLQSRWKTLGNFVLDGSGDFTVASEPIINRSPG